MSNHRYSPEFKDEAVRQIIEAGHSIRHVSDRLGVSTNQLAIYAVFIDSPAWPSHCIYLPTGLR